MASTEQWRAKVLAFLVVVSVLVTGVSFVGVAAAQPTVSVDYDATVSPGEQTTITVNGTGVSELTVKGDVAGWIVNETTPAGFTTFPNPSNTPYESQEGDAWGHVFVSEGSHSFEVVVTAPEQAGTYNFTAEAKGNGTTVTREFTVRVAETTVSVDHPDAVTAGQRTTITVNGTGAAELSVEGDVADWVVNGTMPATSATSPTPSSTPYRSQAGDAWSHAFSAAGTHSFEVVVTPPGAGTYNFTAVATRDGTTVTQEFTVRVIETTVSVDHADTVTPGERTTITVNGTDAGKLSVEGEVADWVVNDTTPATLTTSPNPSSTPYRSQAGDAWGHLFSTVGDHSFEVVVTPPNATGTYNFTAVATYDGTDVTESFAVEVTADDDNGADTGRHESGVSQATFRAVAGEDGNLSRTDVLRAVSKYARQQPIDGITLDRTAVLKLVTYYVKSR